VDNPAAFFHRGAKKNSAGNDFALMVAESAGAR
jgi:hypothetical protein